jgi:hypothetical protein
MPRIPTVTNHAFTNMVENLEQPSLDEVVDFKNLESSIQVALAKGFHDLLSLPHTPVRRTNGR